jgi:hypothetical protein
MTRILPPARREPEGPAATGSGQAPRPSSMPPRQRQPARVGCQAGRRRLAAGSGVGNLTWRQAAFQLQVEVARVKSRRFLDWSNLKSRPRGHWAVRGGRRPGAFTCHWQWPGPRARGAAGVTVTAALQFTTKPGPPQAGLLRLGLRGHGLSLAVALAGPLRPYAATAQVESES